MFAMAGASIEFVGVAMQLQSVRFAAIGHRRTELRLGDLRIEMVVHWDWFPVSFDHNLHAAQQLLPAVAGALPVLPLFRSQEFRDLRHIPTRYGSFISME